MTGRGVVLVEGRSDRAAVLAAAALLGVDLAADGADVVAMGGVTGTAAHLRRLPDAVDRVAVLCDQPELRHVQRAVERLGGRPVTVAVCVEDLEDELVRALGVPRVLAVVEAQGDLRRLAALQQQPAQRGRRPEDQLRRFFGSASGRKTRYAALLTAALGAAEVPRPLQQVLAAVRR